MKRRECPDRLADRDKVVDYRAFVFLAERHTANDRL